MENKKRNKVLDFLQGNMVPILFTVLCLASIKISGQNAGYVITETVSVSAGTQSSLYPLSFRYCAAWA